MRTPVVVLTGVDPDALTGTLLSLSWDVPRAVAVHHAIDPEREVLVRTVSDATGVIEHAEIELAHACISCALREDIVPTIERVARDGRWDSVLACLPVGAEPAQIGTVVAREPRLQRHLRNTAFVAAIAGESVVDDLLGDELLAERGLHAGPLDRRGLGEVGCALVEYADVVVLTGQPDPAAVDLVTALARPTAGIVVGAENLDGTRLLAGAHDHLATRDWSSDGFARSVPAWESPRVWRLELTSPLPFHPGRLLAGIERLGTGRHRSRGRFWLPSRPGQTQVWDGSGGQLSIGPGQLGKVSTRLLFTGVGAQPLHLRETFESLLVAPGESVVAVTSDGLEPWLGTIRDVA